MKMRVSDFDQHAAIIAVIGINANKPAKDWQSFNAEVTGSAKNQQKSGIKCIRDGYVYKRVTYKRSHKNLYSFVLVLKWVFYLGGNLKGLYSNTWMN